MSSGEVTDLNIAGSKGNTNITDNKFCCKGEGEWGHLPGLNIPRL